MAPYNETKKKAKKPKKKAPVMGGTRIRKAAKSRKDRMRGIMGEIRRGR